MDFHHRADGVNDSRDRLIIAGGGLSGSLLALALAESRPEAALLLIESGSTFGGNHIWSFFDPDLDAEGRKLVEPLIAARWDGYDILFPKRRRTLGTAYNSITSDRLDEEVKRRLRPERYRLGARIAEIGPDHVRLEDGETLAAGGVIDARGAANLSGLDLCWQKFVGREFRFDAPHSLVRPVVMDGSVDQLDGYRFVYCLPLSDRRMLVEDTYYSDDAGLDVAVLRGRIDAYLAGRGWVASAEREEAGVLPVALGGRLDSLWDREPGIPKLGLRGGFFHPTTGYTLPDAVRTAQLVARHKRLDSVSLHALLRAEATRLWRARSFYRALNRMLFRAARPAERYRVLEHFYRLDRPIVDRFYAGRSSFFDKVRILTGRPPVPVGRAMKALRGEGRVPE